MGVASPRMRTSVESQSATAQGKFTDATSGRRGTWAANSEQSRRHTVSDPRAQRRTLFPSDREDHSETQSMSAPGGN
jgi:hypothetical protein